MKRRYLVLITVRRSGQGKQLASEGATQFVVGAHIAGGLVGGESGNLATMLRNFLFITEAAAI